MLHAFPFLPPDVDALHAQGGHDLFPHDDVTGGAQFDRGPSKSFTIGFYIRPDPRMIISLRSRIPHLQDGPKNCDKGGQSPV